MTPSLVPSREQVAYYTRVLRVVAAGDFKLKYAGSALGYFWSILKPLAFFTMLYLVFGRVFHLGTISHYYPLSLLTGIVLFYFFSDATLVGMGSIVSRATLIRKLSFPRTIIPVSATLTVGMTFLVNLTVIGMFIAWNGIVPRLNWVLIIPLLLELYIFTLGVTLILATLFVRLRDIGQVWELVQQLFFYASPIVYPIGYLPSWARNISFLSPFTQILQDVRALILYKDASPNRITIATAFGTPAARLLPIGIALVIFATGLLLMRREEPWFAERV